MKSKTFFDFELVLLKKHYWEEFSGQKPKSFIASLPY